MSEHAASSAARAVVVSPPAQRRLPQMVDASPFST
jgi:hypothetical protein